MGKAIDAAAKWASEKSKTRLKHGTNPKAQKRGDVSLAQPRWDQGAAGQANRVGMVADDRGEIDPDTGEKVNPNGVKGARRVDMLETYHKRGWISDRGYTAGEKLRDAWAATQRGKGTDWSAERVDSSPKPDAHIDIQIDRVSQYHAVTRCIAKGDERILDAVVARGIGLADLREYRAINHENGKRHLRDALDRLADCMGV